MDKAQLIARMAERMVAIRARFVAGLPERANAIETSWQAWTLTPTANQATEVVRAVHSLAGAASSFEAPDLASRAKALENALIVAFAQAQGQPLNPDLVAELSHLIAELRDTTRCW